MNVVSTSKSLVASAAILGGLGLAALGLGSGLAHAYRFDPGIAPFCCAAAKTSVLNPPTPQQQAEPTVPAGHPTDESH
jgi:hypothetical protein